MGSGVAVERLSRFWFLRGFEPEELQRIAAFAGERQVPAGQVLFRQGEAPDSFYMVERGVVEEVGIDGAGDQVLHRTAQTGDYLGRWSLMHGGPHRATATVKREATLLTIPADDFRTLLAMVPRLGERLERREVVNRLLAIPLFASFEEEELYHVADLVREVEYPAGQILFREGEPADAFYVIDTGQVVETSSFSARGSQSWPKYFTAGNFLGRFALLNRTTRRATARAETDTTLLRLEAEDFNWLLQLKPEFKRSMKRADIVGCLQQTKVFRPLEEAELKHLAGFTGLVRLRPGDILYRQGDIDPTLYILYYGEAIIRMRDDQGRERPGGYFKPRESAGERSLFLREPRDVTVEATTDSFWCYLTRQDWARFEKQHDGIRSRLAYQPEVQVRRGLKRRSWMNHDEQLVIERHRHWFFLVRKLVLPFLLLLGATALDLVPGRDPLFRLIQSFGWVLSVVALLWVAWRLVDWLNDFFFVTTQRVAHQEKTLLIREKRDEAPLDKVQDLRLDQGFIGKSLGFGGLLIETAAAMGVSRLIFDHLPEPEDVQHRIYEQRLRVRAAGVQENRQFIRDRLESRVGVGLRPSFPRPVIPTEEPVAPPEPQGPSMWQRLGQSTWKQLLWIEQRTAERVTWRKHWIRLVAAIWLPLLSVLAVAGLLIVYLFGPGSKQPLVVLLLMALELAAAFWLWWNWTDWGNDQYVVEDDRVIDVEKSPLGFRTKQTVTTFDKIQNVSFNIPHPIANIFNYGTVTIFTAGAEGKLDFLWVRDPRSVQRELFARLRVYEERQRRRRREEQFELLPEWFAVYDETRGAT